MAARGDRLTLHIDRLAVGGRGVGRSNELVIFVPDVAPDEDVEVEITSVKKNFAEARLINIVKAGPSRIQPPCPVAGICGGCNWQHIAYDEQLRQKRSLVRESLRKFSGFDISDENLVQSVLASPKPLRYRNRVQFHYANGELGYYRRGSHDLVNIDDCPIAEPAIAQAIPGLKARFKDQRPGRIEVFVGEYETAHVRDADSSPVALDAEAENQGGLSFSFSQVNTQQNRNLVSMVVSAFVMKFIDSEKPILFDLYAGSGNFTFPLAKAFPGAKLTAVELNHESVVRGRELTEITSPETEIRWVESDVDTFLKKESIPDGAGVLIDPPRAGCSPDVVAKLAASPLHFFVYVSCHPATLARDLRAFSKAGFKLESVQPFDMFPQTDHVETLAVLSRSTGVVAPPSV